MESTSNVESNPSQLDTPRRELETPWTYSVRRMDQVGLWIRKAVILVEHDGLDLQLLTLPCEGVLQGIREVAELGDGGMGQTQGRPRHELEDVKEAREVQIHDLPLGSEQCPGQQEPMVYGQL